MKVCPICNARAFDDAEVCFGCLHHFDADVSAIHDGCAAVSAPVDREACGSSSACDRGTPDTSLQPTSPVSACAPADARASASHEAGKDVKRLPAQARARTARSHEDESAAGAFGPSAGDVEAQTCCPGDGAEGGLSRASPLECLVRRVDDGAIAFRLNAPSLVSLGEADAEDAARGSLRAVPLMRVPAGAWVRIGAVEEVGGL